VAAVASTAVAASEAAGTVAFSPSVEEVREKLRSLQVSPELRRQLGLPENWADEVSEDFIEKVLWAARRHAAALKTLQDN
jgi:hypothetical protein